MPNQEIEVKGVLISVILIFSSLSIVYTESYNWNLSDSIDQAMSENLVLKQKHIDLEQRQTARDRSWNLFLPDLNADNKIDALEYSAGLRFSPIIITTLAAIFGMLTIAIEIGEGSNIIQPLGIAVSGGLMISTIFTFFAVHSILRLINIKRG